MGIRGLTKCFLILSLLVCSCVDLIVKDVAYEQYTTTTRVMKSTVKNQGSKQAGPSNTTFEIRWNPDWTWNDPTYSFSRPYRVYAGTQTPALDPGQEFEWPLMNMPAGECIHARVCADKTGVVDEGFFGELNNCTTRSFRTNNSCPSCELCCTEVLPAAFSWTDWMGKNWVTPVKNQGHCGACWAFAAVAVVEARKNLEGAAQNISNLDLSEQQLVSCSNPVYSCDGGYADGALQLIKSDGIVEEQYFPYVSGIQIPGVILLEPDCSLLPSTGRWYIGQFTRIGLVDTVDRIADIKSAILCYGPIAVSTLWDPENNGYHAIVLVGWNDTAIPEWVAADTGWSRGGWIFKNSWGTGWGTNGYGLIPFTGHLLSRVSHGVDGAALNVYRR